MLLPLLSFALAADRVIPLDEVARHATPADCWVAIDGGVYDVTAFLPGHPGGPVLQTRCGTDSSALFHARPETGTDHSDAARVILGQLRVGSLPGAAPPSRADKLALRAHSALLATAPTTWLPPAKTLRVDIGHSLSEEANVRVGFQYAITDKIAVELVHATLDGESDVGLTVAHGSRTFRGGLHAGVGYRFKGVPEGDGMGIYAELPLQLNLAQQWVGVHLVPGVAVLPSSAGDVARVGGAAGLTLRPWPLVSFFGEARYAWAEPAPDWAGGVRLHTAGHTFAVWAGSSYALTPLDRLAPGVETSFAVGFGLERDFSLARKRR